MSLVAQKPIYTAIDDFDVKIYNGEERKEIAEIIEGDTLELLQCDPLEDDVDAFFLYMGALVVKAPLHLVARQSPNDGLTKVEDIYNV